MSENWKHKLLSARPELVALGLLIPLVIILGAVFTRLPAQQTGVSGLASSPSSEASPTPIASPRPSTSLGVNQAPDHSGSLVEVGIVGPGEKKHYHVPIMQEVAVADVLQQAQQQGLQLQTKDFGGSLGLFVEAINGVKNEEGKQMYWTLYVNGTRSSLGASSARVKPGDVITWKFENVHEE